VKDSASLGPLVVAGLVLGVGLGGFVDGIVFHQVLQWHAMLSAWRPPVTLLDKQVNTFWDGLFHSVTWLTTVAGIGLLWRALKRPQAPRSGIALVGAMLMGWGLFNIVEGVIDHHILDIHHVNETVPREQWVYWDLGFLAWGAAMLVAGAILVRRGRAVTSARPAATQRPR
jgi:uncharacterized membrane protein